MERCRRCNRPLKTPESIERGFGLVCKRKHDKAYAEYLKLQITIDDEFKYQEAVGGR